jgi:protein TonB
MRPYTIAFSIVAHAIAVCAAIIAPLLATDELPAPRTATEFVEVVPVAPPPPPPPAPRRTTPPDAPPRANAAPLLVPDGVAPELPVETANDAPPVDGGIISFGNCDTCGSVDVVPPPPPLPPPPALIRHVGGDITPPRKVVDVAPVYPPLARAARVEGLVILEAVIAEDGSVRDVRLLRSVPLLDAAAVEAVRQWRFTPTLLNRQPVPVVMTITVAFTLR